MNRHDAENFAANLRALDVPDDAGRETAWTPE
jgi:hypothetical protein